MKHLLPLICAFLLLGPVLAEETAETPADATTRELAELTEAREALEDGELRLDLQQVLASGGVLIYVLGAMSVVALALIFTFSITLSGKRVTPANFLRDMEVLLQQQRYDDIRAACEKNRSPAAAILLAAVSYTERAGGEPDPDLLQQVVEGEGIRQAGRLQSQITYLMDIGVIAPMVGLLGTVMGMLTSFGAVALDIHKARPMVLAAGVSQALVTTAAGLIVAIPAMMFYSVFRGRLGKLTGALELAATDFVTLLAHRGPRT